MHGPFGNAVDVLVQASGGTVTVTDQAFTLANEPDGDPRVVASLRPFPTACDDTARTDPP